MLPARRIFAAFVLSAAAVGAVAQTTASRNDSASWQSLSAPQRAALAPLQDQWAAMDTARREKWLEVANRVPTLPADERARLQARMSQWSTLSGDERGQARLQYQEAQRWTPQDRQTRWDEYQSLHPEARKVLAERWKLEAAARASEARAPSTAKRNVIEATPRPDSPRRSASPTTIKAPAGATSTLISPRPVDRGAERTGVPKVAATETFVDPLTLLPRRGPQAAAVVAVPARAPNAPMGQKPQKAQ